MRPIVRKRILEKFNNTCVDCGATENLHIDHIIPLSIGGREDEDNMQVLCRTCNLKKHNKLTYKGLIKIDENYDKYILVSRDALYKIADTENYKKFTQHLCKVLENPEKYLPVYGVKNGK